MARSLIGSAWTTQQDASLTTIPAPSRNITAGSVVIYRWRYETGAPALSSFSDGTAASWTTLEFGTNPTVGYAVCLNHPGGTGTVGTVTLSSGRNLGWIRGVELTGGSATIDDAPAGVTGTGPTLTYTATGDGTAFAVTGYYSGSSITPTSPAVLEDSQFFSGYWKLDHTGAGSKSMVTAGGSGNTVSLVVVIKDAAPAAPVITGPSGAGGTLTGNGSVSTDTGSGTLWWKVDASTTATDPGAGGEAGAGWTSQAVSAAGTQVVSSFGALTAGAKFAHYLHVAATGRSTVANSASFSVVDAGAFSVSALMGDFVAGLSLAQTPGVINFGPLKNGSGFRWDRSDITAIIQDRTTGSVLATLTSVVSGVSGGQLSSLAIQPGGLYRVSFRIPPGGLLPNGAKGEADLSGA